jgi:hypothetical protein
VSIIGMEFSHRNLDPLGRKKRGNPGSGGKDFPSHSAVVVCRSLFVMSLCLFTHFRGNV